MKSSNQISAGRHVAPKNGRQFAVVSVLLACVLFSTSATGRAYLDFPGSSISVGAWRVFLGGIGLAGYVVYRYGASNLRILMKLPIVWVMATAASCSLAIPGCLLSRPAPFTDPLSRRPQAC